MSPTEDAFGTKGFRQWWVHVGAPTLSIRMSALLILTVSASAEQLTREDFPQRNEPSAVVNAINFCLPDDSATGGEGGDPYGFYVSTAARNSKPCGAALPAKPQRRWRLSTSG